jgi:16S rRNA (guanine527-N7)-methyltransferase
VFGAALPRAERYAEVLATSGVVRGLIGPRETPRLWSRHLLNCAVVAEALPARAAVADIGSGAGLPGVVIALARPDLAVTLVEPLLRRSTFLDEVVSELALTHVQVVRARAEQLHGERTFDAVTSRAVAPLDRLARWCLPLVGPTGVMLAMKGASAAAEVLAAEPTLRSLGALPAEVIQLGLTVIDPPTTVVRVRRAHPTV